jgi:GNAT superfamily N-acetyltransferase
MFLIFPTGAVYEGSGRIALCPGNFGRDGSESWMDKVIKGGNDAMNHFTFAAGYSSNDVLREKLYPLFERVFKIPVHTLEDFYQRGFWNPSYRPYTFFDGDKAVANVSMFTMPLMIKQKTTRVAAIQSVMTDPDYRGKGLMKQLMKKMLKDIDREFETAMLLTSSPELYIPFGFRQAEEHYFVAPWEHHPKQGEFAARKLDFFDGQHVHMIREAFRHHRPVSYLFAPLSHESSFYLNMYSPYYRQKLYYLDKIDVILVYEVDGETLKLYDCVGKELPTLEELCSQIPVPFSRIECYFSPDMFQGKTKFVPVKTESHLMVRGRLEVEGECFKLPITAAF